MEDILWGVIKEQNEYISLLQEEIRKATSSLEYRGYKYDRSKLEESENLRDSINATLEVCKKIKNKQLWHQ